MQTIPQVAVVLTLALVVPGVVEAQGRDPASCDDLLPPRRRLERAAVGPESCRMLEAEVTWEGRKFFRLDLGLDGTAEGWVIDSGTDHEYLTNGPDQTFEQAGNHGKRRLAIARYERAKGAAILLLLPASRAEWNGKLFVTAHGRGRSFRNGALRVWDRYLDAADPMAAFDRIHRVMLSKGYAVAVTKRTSEQGIGEIEATLEDGSVVDWAAFNDNAAIIMDYARVGEAAIERRLGELPARTYLYGHSAGARIGRSLNYTPGLNADARGEPVIDGFLLDDSATGLWLPVVMREGRDVLFATEADRAAFRPQIEIVHQMYNSIWERAPERPDWVSTSYLANKRLNARILMDKGLGGKFRMFEIRQMTHNGGEGMPEGGRAGSVRVLDVSRVMDGAIDILDALVEGRAVPKPSRSDWAAIGDADGDGVIENPALSYPEVTCPLGVFYPYPQNGSGSTAFAGFTGEGLEPLDRQSIFVDMNRNGAWDFRETPTEAWRRLGLLGPREPLTRERYVRCVSEAAASLRDAGFFSDATVQQYVRVARMQDLTPSAQDGPS
ncbi:MAG TPA: hypothetical protein VF981_02900 [Gemmatimonadaceae bacterium]